MTNPLLLKTTGRFEKQAGNVFRGAGHHGNDASVSNDHERRDPFDSVLAQASNQTERESELKTKKQKRG